MRGLLGHQASRRSCLPAGVLFDMEKAFDTIPRDGLWTAVAPAKLKGLSVLEQCSVEGPSRFNLLYPISITQAQRKRPQHQRVVAVDTRAETTTRLDLSHLCFVDNLLSLLIFWRKSQLSRFAEMVSQVLESGSFKAEHISSRSEGGGEGTIRATTFVKFLGCQLESRKHACRGTNANIQGLQGPSSVFTRVVGPLLHRLEHQTQAVADTGPEHLAVCGRSTCMATARRGNSGKVAKPRFATHCKSPVHVSGRRTQDPRGRLGARTVTSTVQVRRLFWAKNAFVREHTHKTNVLLLVKP